MGRYRPPEPEKTPIITAAGFSRLRQELNHLWKIKRPQVTARVAAAAALGDRSENADYIYGKKQLAEIDHRIRYLDKRIRTMQVVDRPPNDSNKIYFGAWVTLTSVEGDHKPHYRLVGPDEIDEKPEYISIDSPMAKALLGKTLGDEIAIVQSATSTKVLTFEQTAEPTRYWIHSIVYSAN
jgi:transcription elongation factor GreB